MVESVWGGVVMTLQLQGLCDRRIAVWCKHPFTTLLYMQEWSGSGMRSFGFHHQSIEKQEVEKKKFSLLQVMLLLLWGAFLTPPPAFEAYSPINTNFPLLSLRLWKKHAKVF